VFQILFLRDLFKTLEKDSAQYQKLSKKAHPLVADEPEIFTYSLVFSEIA
jgi:hypothetical protein